MNPDERTISESNIDTVVENIIGGKRNVVLDSQILSSLMGCPRLTDFRFNLNLYSIDGKSNSLECGSIVHIFLEYFYRAIIARVHRNQAVQIGMGAAELYIKGCPHCSGFIPFEKNENGIYEMVKKPSCGHKIDEFPGVKNTPKDSTDKPKRTGWQHVLDTCDQYQLYWKNDFWVPLEVETVHGKILYEDDEIRILWKAKVDSLFDTNQGIFPMDHKSMSQNRDTTSLNNQFMGQCVTMGVQKICINKVGFQTSLKPEEKFLRPFMNYSVPRLLEWQGETLPYYAKLLIMYAEAGHWPPNYDHCDGKYGKCAFHKVCEGNPDDRTRLLKELFVVGPEWNPSNEED